MLSGILVGFLLGPIGFFFSDGAQISAKGIAIGWMLGWFLLIGVGSFCVATRNEHDAERVRKSVERQQQIEDIERAAKRHIEKLQEEKYIKNEQDKRNQELIIQIEETNKRIAELGGRLNDILDGRRYPDFNSQDLRFHDIPRFTEKSLMHLADADASEQQLKKLLRDAEKLALIIERRIAQAEKLRADKIAKYEASKMQCKRCRGVKMVLKKIKCDGCDGIGKITGDLDCTGCRGKGALYYRDKCVKCKGKGKCRPLCSFCKGSGQMTCAGCKGQGVMKKEGSYRPGLSGSNLALRRINSRCGTCRGTGKVTCTYCSESMCTICKGDGYAKYSEVCTVCTGKGKIFGEKSCDKCVNGLMEKFVDCDECKGRGWISSLE